MATPMPAISFTQERLPPLAQRPGSECSPQTAQELIEMQHRKFEAEIQHAKETRELLLDDGESVYSEATLARAAEFLKTHLRWCWRKGSMVPLPSIGPGPNGSIDLYWQTPQRKLLVNVPAPEELPATFYGDDCQRQNISGSFDARGLSLSVIAWLKD